MKIPACPPRLVEVEAMDSMTRYVHSVRSPTENLCQYRENISLAWLATSKMKQRSAGNIMMFVAELVFVEGRLLRGRRAV